MLERDFKRFVAKVVISPDGCLLWTTALTHDGYGRFSFRGVQAMAHRAAYEHWVGPIPEGLGLDHLCRVRACVNPVHLEPVPLSVNVSRGLVPIIASLAKRPDPSLCGNGLHEWIPENLTTTGTRQCKHCRNASRRR